MPRLARPVFAGVPHHITQRGNRRENVFFSDADRESYLEWLAEYCAVHGVEVLAYCLMSNHVHLVAVPERGDGLERVLRPLHTRYAQRINRLKRWKVRIPAKPVRHSGPRRAGVPGHAGPGVTRYRDYRGEAFFRQRSFGREGEAFLSAEPRCLRIESPLSTTR